MVFSLWMDEERAAERGLAADWVDDLDQREYGALDTDDYESDASLYLDPPDGGVGDLAPEDLALLAEDDGETVVALPPEQVRRRVREEFASDGESIPEDEIWDLARELGLQPID